jgi:hypothetical protein
MTNFFSRSGGSVAKNFHSYIAEDPTLQNIGLASYTRNGLEAFGKEPRPSSDPVRSKEILEYFGGTFPEEVLLGDGEDVTLSLMAYDKEVKRYYEKTDLWSTPSGVAARDLKEFQERFDLIQKGFDQSLTAEEKAAMNIVWTEIQTSKEGCITFTANYTVLECDKTSLIKIYFQSGGKANTSREIAQKGSPIIADVPRRPTGPAYSQARTRSAGVGQYIPPLEGGNNNPENTVAGKLRMAFNSALGQWEAGTQQMLVRLVGDLDGVSVPDLPTNIDDPTNDYYEGPLSMGAFNVGSGIPISVEDGNPHLFGPNIIGCGDGSKVEKIRVVNRTPRTYAAGEIILCSLIGPDWIPMGFGLPKATVAKKFSAVWSNIQKYIVSGKDLFSDATDFREGMVTSESYTDSVRARFYKALSGTDGNYFPRQLALLTTASGSNDIQKIALLNMNPAANINLKAGPDGKITPSDSSIGAIQDINIKLGLIPSTGYLQVFDADVIPTPLGGNNTRHETRPASNMLKNNVSKMTYDEPENSEIWAESTPNSWGLYFSDGYTSASVAKLKNNKQEVSSATSYQVYAPTEKLDFSPSGQARTGSAAENENIQNFDVFDSNLYHFPAQIGLNASGNQSIVSSVFWTLQNSASRGVGNYADIMMRYLQAPYKGDWIVTTSGRKDVFALEPANPTRVQFSPLSLQLALCSTLIPESERSVGTNQGGYGDLLRTLEASNAQNGALGAATLGNLWKRNNFKGAFDIDKDKGVKGYIGFTNHLIDYVNGDSIVEAKKKRSPDGGPQIFPIVNSRDEYSDVAGIISAEATLTISNGGMLEMTTYNRLGYNSYSTTGGGGGSIDVTILGSMGAWSSDNRGQITTRGTVQWGSSDNDMNPDSMGTIALFAKVYDHCENTIYDGRYFAPLHFNPDPPGKSDPKKIDFTTIVPSGNVGRIGSVVDKDTVLTFATNPIRRNMLLSGGGFLYLQNLVGADPNGIEIVNSGIGYAVGNIVTFTGKEDATFEVSQIGSNGEIRAVTMTSAGVFTTNPFKIGKILGSIKQGESAGAIGVGATVYLKKGMVIEVLGVDEEPASYGGRKLLSRNDNNGNGDGKGEILGTSQTTSFNLLKNSSGKYDVFFHMINDIMCYTENSYASTYLPINAYAQYIKLEMSAG